LAANTTLSWQRVAELRLPTPTLHWLIAANSFCIFCLFISGKNIGLEAKDRIKAKKVQHSIISSFVDDGVLISGLIMFRGFGLMPNPCVNAPALEL